MYKHELNGTQNRLGVKYTVRSNNHKTITMSKWILDHDDDSCSFISPFGLCSTQSNINATLQIPSDTEWSSKYGTVDGHGNKDILFSCSGTYSADFQEKSERPGFLTLNIIQNKSNPAFTPNNATAPIVGNSSNYTVSSDSNAVSKQFPEYTPQIINSKSTTEQLPKNTG